MISRLYVEKRAPFASEAARVLRDAKTLLGIEGLTEVRLLQRYDVQGLSEAEFATAVTTVFSEPPVDRVLTELPAADFAFGVQFLPGQFDQRADSAESCLQLQNQGERPRVHSAQIYLLTGQLSPAELTRLKDYLINPVDSQEIDPTLPPSFTQEAPNPNPTPEVPLDNLAQLHADLGLAMDLDDLELTRSYFESEGRAPTLAELRVIDTYWSDHCRHTTFLTELTELQFEDPRAQETFAEYQRLRAELGRTKPITLMDLGTIAARYLKPVNLDESEEINACTVRVTANVDGHEEPWLLLFKNETHNHPTEIEPFGGAATCIGGAIRDPLSGRAFVYQAMRVTGAGDPRLPLDQTLPGKLPQRQIVNEAADGYSSYGNQIGLATGQVTEVYHPGYVAKRMEVGAVVGAAPAANVVRERPAPGDLVVLLGGKTGRDGCGGATGSSKTHTTESITESGAEVQKGNAPEERKIQRLFRDPAATRLIKRCNDFGAGGVSVAIGELAPGLRIDLDRVPVKYQGLTGTELAISESQERMAVVLAPADVDRFLALAAGENLEATVVAEVTEEPRLVMVHRGQEIINLSRAFLDTNGAPKEADATVTAPDAYQFPFSNWDELARDLNIASQRGLVERFDATVGAASVLMPLGGRRQLTPTQAMAALLPTRTTTASVMSFGFNPAILAADPYAGAYLAVVESLAKLVATGAGLEQAYLTFQEYFPRLFDVPARWGLPVSALLGALRAQVELGVAAVGGKDSMSGTFENLDVPPTLVSFAVTVAEAAELISPEFKQAGSTVVLLSPELGPDGLPQADSLRQIWDQALTAIRSGQVLSAWTPGQGGVAEGLLKMAVGNRIGVTLEADAPVFSYRYGALVLELAPGAELAGAQVLGQTTSDYLLHKGSTRYDLAELEAAWTETLAEVFPISAPVATDQPCPVVTSSTPTTKPASNRTAKPKFLIPVFPGTNSEYDTARAVEEAGGEAELFVVQNLTAADIARSSSEFARSLSTSQVLLIPGGFSGGDEPDGSAKFITSFLRNPEISAELTALLDRREGLVGGICNGFQALIKLGLVPYGKIVEPTADSPTLTHNLIGRHQSRLVRTRIASTLSPWLSEVAVGDVVSVAISHGEGRLVASEEELARLGELGQIATQYVDQAGQPTMDVDFNPAGSMWAIEALTSPDGRVIGKMGHAERIGPHLYRNVPGQFELGMFRSAVKYFAD
ncbi:phosphoribosylformylglycinamidine synthase [Scrofimicrobium sp. R131]|uniref:Phosphoribosylformylglycinamidine synthase n=1 Tax=Scrofimicrobium appendicitidis TaxID=3079930 RepID=A0AAU7V656_9ACTO